MNDDVAFRVDTALQIVEQNFNPMKHGMRQPAVKVQLFSDNLCPLDEIKEGASAVVNIKFTTFALQDSFVIKVKGILSMLSCD